MSIRGAVIAALPELLHCRQETRLAMQVPALFIFPRRRNQPEGSRAFALLPHDVVIMRTPERLVCSRLSPLPDFTRLTRRCPDEPVCGSGLSAGHSRAAC